METIWLQRSSQDIPWGFRLVGGREFGVPLTVQRVTPGSVAAAGLGPGDIILKVGNVMATNLGHNDAQELVKQAGNILQLTIRKGDGTAPSGPLSPGSGYGSQVTAQVNDSSYSAPKGFGTGIPININVSTNAEPRYATTPRNYGSQYQSPMQGTRIEIQRVNPPQQPSGYGGTSYEDDGDSGGPSFPDYTIPYKQQGPVHDTPGGPVNIRGFKPPSESSNYSSKSLPRGVGSYNDRDGVGTAGGPPAYEPTSYNASQSSFSPSNILDTKFSTGIPYQASSQKPQPYSNAPQAYGSVSAPQPYSSPAHSYNTPSYTGPMSPQSQSSSTSGFVSTDRKPSPYSTDSGTPSQFYNQTPSGYGSSAGGGSSFDQSSVHGSGSNKYSTLPHTKPSYGINNNNIYNSAPQPYSAPKPFTPAQSSSSYSSSQPPFSPSSGYSGNAYPSSSQPAIRRVSFDQNLHDNGPYSPATNFSPRPYKSPPPPSNVAPSYGRSASQHDDYGVTDFGASTPQPASFARQSSRSNDPYTASPYVPPGGPMSPRSDTYYDGSRDGYDPSDVSAGVGNMNLSSPYHPPPPAAPAPPPPPPPPPSGPPPPPAPPLGDWNATPYRRQPSQQQNEDADDQRVSDVLLKSARAGGPKPFSYGIDLSELKKKIGPPTAPKPRQGQPGYEEYQDAPEMPRRYGGPPRKPAGHVQSDYFIKRDDDQDTPRTQKKPAGLVQSDYYLSQETGPRSEVDESPININMGTNPKKQSKSFKVLQWMTETEKDETDEPVQKPKRSKDPERRHNADDDEMRFSGLHSKADIPSKAFGLLQKMPIDNSGATQNGQNTLGVGDAEDDVGNYDETSIRYKGKNIPSPSFRILQTWAEHDPDPNINMAGNKKDDDEEDDLPDTLDNEEMVDKRYKGGTIPSKVFKTLQKSVGDDTPETPPDQTRRASAEGGQAQQGTTAPISDF